MLINSENKNTASSPLQANWKKAIKIYRNKEQEKDRKKERERGKERGRGKCDMGRKTEKIVNILQV